MNKEKLANVLGIILITVFSAYAVVCAAFQFAHGVSGLLDGFIILFVGFVFCLIMGFSFFGKWGKFMRRINRQAEAQALDDEYKKAVSSEKEEKKVLTAEEKKKKRSDTIAGVAVLLICLAVAVGIWIFAAKEIERLHAPNFVEVEATLTRVFSDGENSRLCYAFYDLNGNLQYAVSSQSWGGVKFIEGNTVTIFYHTMHPEVVREPSSPVMLILIGCMFALIGLLACLHTSGHEKFLPFIVGTIFTGFPIGFQTGVAITGGFSFGQLIVSGGAVYACNCFLILGIYCFGVGIAQTVAAVRRRRR